MDLDNQLSRRRKHETDLVVRTTGDKKSQGKKEDEDENQDLDHRGWSCSGLGLVGNLLTTCLGKLLYQVGLPDDDKEKMDMKIIHIGPGDDELRRRYHDGIVNLERLAEYPWGHGDSFRIDHGRDYFAFFDRLGQTHYYVAVATSAAGDQEREDRQGEGDRVVAVGAGVLRRLKNVYCWYMCDLKVHPEFRGRHIPMRIFSEAAVKDQQYARCSRGYAISMNSQQQEPNRMARMFQHHSWLARQFATEIRLLIYSLDCKQMHKAETLLLLLSQSSDKSSSRRHRYVSLHGIKDLILGSTGEPLPLLHLHWHPLHMQQNASSHAAAYKEPQPGFQHMFCLPSTHRLVRELRRQCGFAPAASATIISHNMDCRKADDWLFVATSDI